MLLRIAFLSLWQARRRTGALGTAIAFVSMLLVLLSDQLIIIPTLKWVLISLAFITTVVTSISILPASLAARMKPVTAMAHAG